VRVIADRTKVVVEFPIGDQASGWKPTPTHWLDY